MTADIEVQVVQDDSPDAEIPHALTKEQTVDALEEDISKTFPGLGLFQVCCYSLVKGWDMK
jgi:hypothetical protein